MSFIIDELNEELNKLNEGLRLNDVGKNAKEISNRYRSNKNDGKRLLTEYEEAVSYALSRMPATYGAVSSVLKSTFENNNFEVNSVLDVGAGTGTATWAIYDFLGKNEYTCLEREESMIKVGKTLMQNHSDLKDTKWIKYDVTSNEDMNSADLVIASYIINELNENMVEKIILKLWESTNNVLLIIEPGTPHGFSNIKKIRDILIKQGGNIIAPCTHQNECPIGEDDWCSFSCRVQRSKVHRILKEGSASYEDEKFSYIAFSKNNATKVNNRILRHPIINKGYTEFKVCTPDGINNIKLSKKDGQLYKDSKKKNIGDTLDL